jgi:hypothetical protein
MAGGCSFSGEAFPEVSAQAEERQDGEDDYDGADEINDAVHGVVLHVC